MCDSGHTARDLIWFTDVTVSEIHAITIKRLSKIEAAYDRTDGASDE
jgi:hypothetical protein